jgi:hypothetical protein
MYRYFKLTGYSFILFTAMLLVASCNNGGDEKKGTDNSGTDSSKNTAGKKQVQPKATALTGTLDNLWIEAAAFNALPNKKISFCFAFRTNDTLTLYGWTCKGLVCTGSYDTDPAIKLKKGMSSGESYGPEVYFGNVMLYHGGVHDIQKVLGNKYQYVVFVPKNTDGFISYKVYVTNDDPTHVKAFTSVDTDVELNPSPPKNW